MNCLQLDWIAIRSCEMQSFTSAVSFSTQVFQLSASAKLNFSKVSCFSKTFQSFQNSSFCFLSKVSFSVRIGASISTAS